MKRSHYKYKNLSWLAVSVLAAVLVSAHPSFQQAVMAFGAYGVLGAFLGGFFFVSTFTVALGTIILAALADKVPVWEISVLAGLGAMVADTLIFRFVRDGLSAELVPLFRKFGGRSLAHLIHSRHFAWTAPVIGAIIIASPLPDELGVGLLGMSKIPSPVFMLMTFVLNTAGIFVLVSAAALVALDH